MQPIEPLDYDEQKYDLSYELINTTMGALEGNLPHGFLTVEGRATSFGFRPPTMGTRKRLGAIAGRPKIKRIPGKHVCYWLANALLELAGEDWAAPASPDSKEEHKRALRVAKLTIGDVLFLMFAWQYHARPKGLPLSADSCGACGQSFHQVLVDLATLECVALPDDASEGNPPVARVALPQGFPHLDKEVGTVLVAPPKWVDVFWDLPAQQWTNRDLVRAHMIKAEVVGLDTAKLAILPMEAVDEMWPDDVDAIDGVASMITPSPILEIEVPCPRCQSVNRTVLDWQTPDFFGR